MFPMSSVHLDMFILLELHTCLLMTVEVSPDLLLVRQCTKRLQRAMLRFTQSCKLCTIRSVHNVKGQGAELLLLQVLVWCFSLCHVDFTDLHHRCQSGRTVYLVASAR